MWSWNGKHCGSWKFPQRLCCRCARLHDGRRRRCRRAELSSAPDGASWCTLAAAAILPATQVSWRSCSLASRTTLRSCSHSACVAPTSPPSVSRSPISLETSLAVPTTTSPRSCRLPRMRGLSPLLAPRSHRAERSAPDEKSPGPCVLRRASRGPRKFERKRLSLTRPRPTRTRARIARHDIDLCCHVWNIGGLQKRTVFSFEIGCRRSRRDLLRSLLCRIVCV